MTKAGLLRVFGVLSVFALSQTACGEDESFPCGDDLTCEEDQICVEESYWKTTDFRCVENPCGSAKLSCDCAASACDVGTCNSVAERKVSCVCLAC
jgi:hypothetical protein